MMYRFIDYLWIMFSVFAGMSIIIAFLFVSDRIDITFTENYLEEYAECKTNLERLTPNCPNCPDCVCKTSSGFFISLIAFIWGLLIMFIIMGNKEKISKWFNKRNKN